MSTRISDDTLEKVQAFRTRFESLGYGEGHFVLACHAAFPVALTPDLLHQLWANFKTYTQDGELKSIDSIAVSDLLLSFLCMEVSRDIFEMDMETRAYLLEQLKNDPRFGQPRMKQLGYFLYQYMQEVGLSVHNKTFVDAQTWTALATIAPRQAADEIATALKSAIESKNHNEVLRMRNLLESYSNQETAFENLLHYAKGLKAAIMNYPGETVQQQFDLAKARVLTIEEGAAADNTILEIPILEEIETMVKIPEEVLVSSPMEKAMFRIHKEQEEQSGRLDLAALALEIIPPEVFELSHLRVLDLFDNHINHLPPDIAKLEKLEELLISKNPIAELPATLSRIPSLKVFKLDYGHLNEFPEVLLSMNSLEDISMEKNNIDFLPPDIVKLEKLRALDLRENPLVNIPRALREGLSWQFRDYFKKLEPLPSGRRVMLFLSSDPKQQFNIDGELRSISAIFSGLVSNKELQIIDERNITVIKLFELCRRYQNQLFIFHYAGFDLSVPGEDRELQAISPALFSKLVGQPAQCKAMILNTCYSAEHAQRISSEKGIPCIGVEGEVMDDMAVRFSDRFYQYLMDGLSIGAAYERVKNDLDDSGSKINYQSNI